MSQQASMAQAPQWVEEEKRGEEKDSLLAGQTEESRAGQIETRKLGIQQASQVAQPVRE